MATLAWPCECCGLNVEAATALSSDNRSDYEGQINEAALATIIGSDDTPQHAMK